MRCLLEELASSKDDMDATIIEIPDSTKLSTWDGVMVAGYDNVA
jgi:hypothetical protein